MKIEHKVEWEVEEAPNNKVEIVEEQGEKILKIDMSYCIRLKSLNIDVIDERLK